MGKLLFVVQAVFEWTFMDKGQPTLALSHFIEIHYKYKLKSSLQELYRRYLKEAHWLEV